MLELVLPLDALSTGDDNTVIGYQSALATTTGSLNTFLGRNAGDNLTTGEKNIFIGYSTKSYAVDSACQIVIGAGLTSVGNAYITLGEGSGTNRVYNCFSSNATWTKASDQRLKTDVINSALGLDFINNLNPVSYKFIEGGKEVVDGDLVSIPGSRTHYGLIAQEVKEVLDASGVEDFAGWVKMDVSQEDSMQGLRYDQFIAPLIKAVQELTARVKALEEI